MTSENHKPLPDDATAQEVFDTIVTRMVAQGRQSVDENGECLYLGPEGLACAVGCILEKPIAKRLNVCGTVDSIYQNSSLLKGLPGVLLENISLLDELQIAHDCADRDFVPEFCISARDVAQKHGLTFPEVTP